jgi:hypothetical protein
MNRSTPSRDCGTDTRNDPTGRHGDVDTNGDLVDELRRLLPSESPVDLDEHVRLVADVVEHARTRGRIRQLRRPWTVSP